MTAHDDLVWERLHPASSLVAALRALPRAVLGLVGVSWVVSRETIVMAGVAGIAALIAVIIAYLSWRRFRFAVSPTELRIERGLISRQRRVIPLDRINDIDIERGPLHRLFGLAAVRIETGGGDKDEGVLDSVGVARAMTLRDRLREAGRVSTHDTIPVPEGDLADIFDRGDIGDVVFRMSTARLLLVGTFNFSLVYLAVAFSALQQFGPAFGLSWRQLARRAEIRDGLDLLAGVWGVLAAIGIVTVLGIVTGLVRSVMSDWGFTLRRRARSIVRRRGLLTISEVAIALRRVQAAHVSSGPVMRAFGLARLHVQTLGGAGGDESGGRGMEVLVPIGTGQEIERVAGHAFPIMLPPTADYARGVARAVIAPLLGVVVLTSLAMVALGLRPDWPVWPLPFGSAALAAIAASRWRVHGLAMTEDLLFIRRGWWRRNIAAVPYRHIQAAIVRRGPIDRLLGLARVLVDSAGAGSARALTSPRLPHAAAHALASALLSRARAR